MIQEIGTRSRLRVVSHRDREPDYFSKLISPKQPFKDNSCLFVEVGSVQGLWRTNDQKRCRTVVSVKFAGETLFTKSNDNVSNPKFGDCFAIPLRHKADACSLVRFKVMMLEGDGDFDQDK